MLRTLIAIIGMAAGAAMAAGGAVATFGGIGLVHIGATVKQLSAALGHPVAVPEDPEESACFYEKGPNGVGIMVVDGRVSRIDVDQPGVMTSAGAQVGDTIAKVRGLYGPSLEESPHFYSGLPDLYLTF